MKPNTYTIVGNQDGQMIPWKPEWAIAYNKIIKTKKQAKKIIRKLSIISPDLKFEIIKN